MTQSSPKDISKNVTNDGHFDNQKSNLATNNYAENQIDWGYEPSFSDTKVSESELQNQPSLPTKELQSGMLQGLSKHF